MPDVVIPVLDEAGALPALLSAMPAGYHCVVVDNGSTDGSGDIARNMGALVVSEPMRGFGSACWAGLQAASHPDGVVCFMDGDGSFDPGQLPLVADPVLGGHADLVLGRRRAMPGAWPRHARIANRALSGLLRRRSGVVLSDLGPMRAGRRQELVGLDLRDRRSGWPLEMVLQAARHGWRISEVDVDYHPRVGRSKVTGTLRGTIRAIQDMGGLLMAETPASAGPAGRPGS